MRKNIGNLDKSIRILVTLVVGILYFTSIISGTTAIILGIVVIVFLLTAFINFCPLYTLLGINTLKKRRK